MNIREPGDFHGVQQKRKRRHSARRARHLFSLALITSLICCLLIFALYNRPLPAAGVTAILPVVETQSTSIRWPSEGNAAIGLLNHGILDSTKDQKQGPIASVTKVMVALAVLKQHPLKPNEDGPTLTVTARDVAVYNNYVENGGSVVNVYEGEEMTQREALEALMLPSANNIADMLVTWAYSSVDEYYKAANHIASTIGMTNTKFAGDASGLSRENVSTAKDLIQLGQAALNNPVLREIVAEKSAIIPNVGTINNTNFLLGRNGINGIKTGHTDEAGGCYLFSADLLVDGKVTTVIGAITNTRDLAMAMNSAIPLLDSVKQGFAERSIIKAGQSVGSVSTPWGSGSEIIATKDMALYGWKRSVPNMKLNTTAINGPLHAETYVGNVSATLTNSSDAVPVALKSDITKPSIKWRIFHW